MLQSLLVLAALSIPRPPAPAFPSGEAAPVAAASASLQEEGEAEEPEEPAWKGAINLGFSTTSGNTDVTTLTLDLNAKRERDGVDRTSVKAFHNFSEEDGDVTQRESGASLQYDYFVSERTYLLGRASVEADEQAELDLRYTVGAGVGYKLIKQKKKQELDVEAGLTFVSESFEDSSNDEEFLSLRLASKYFYVFNENVRFESEVEVLPSLENSEDLVAKADNRLIVKLSENLNAMFQVVFDYDNSPAAGRDELDGRYVMSIGYSF